MLRFSFVAAAVVASAAHEPESQICIVSAHNLPENADSWPKKPAPEAWVKVELGGRMLCKTEQVHDSLTPHWEHCCDLGGAHQHSWFWFSVFDDDYAGPENDYLGSAGLAANSPSGVYELELTGGGKTPKEGKAILTVRVPVAPPPPPPPRGGASQVDHGELASVLFSEAKHNHDHEGEADVRKYLCIMSAKGLPESDFFPRVGVFKSPDSWVKITTVTSKESAFKNAAKDALEMDKAQESKIQSHLDMENQIGEKHAGSEQFECASPVMTNDLNPDWSYCCDVTDAKAPYFLMEIFDEDSIYIVNDFLGASVLPASAVEGQYELEITGGYDQGTLNVLLVESAHPPVMNKGEDCWEKCGNQAGVCPKHCGTMGACCKKDWPAPGCPTEGADPFWHSCLAADVSTLLTAEPLSETRARMPLAAAAVAAAALGFVAVGVAALRKSKVAAAGEGVKSSDGATML